MEPIIRLAIDIKSLVKHKPHDASFKAVLELPEIIKSMQSETASDQVLQSTNNFFKNKLLPLYQSVTDLTLQLASKLLEQVIRRLHSVRDEKSVLLRSMPNSIISGLLGLLEVDKKSSTKALIAQYFYEIISENYFLHSPIPGLEFEKTNDATLTAAYQLLSESSISHPENQSKLRDPTRLGGLRIGLTLAKLRDYLSVEALLELFANLLPSARAVHVKGKRRQFIEQVFRPENFSNSQDIIHLLEEHAPDWSIISQRISDLIASEMPLFPQAFEAKEFYVGHSEVYNTERVYVNGSGFLASIDEGDSLGTIQIPYCKIETLSISNPTNGKTAVTVILKSPPIKNQQVMSLSSSQEIEHFRCVWEINANDTRKLVNVLKQRNLGFSVASQRKISLAGSGVAFSGNHISHQSQTNAIASLWSAINPSDRTSPILMPPTSYRIGLAPLPKRDEGPHQGGMPIVTEPIVNDAELPVRPVSLGSGLEDSPSQIVRKVTRKSRNTLLVSSDSDSAASMTPESDNPPGTNVKVVAGVKLGRQTRSTTRPVAGSPKAFQSPHVTALGKRKLSDESDNRTKGKRIIPPVKRPRVKRDTGEQGIPSKIKTPKTVKPHTKGALSARESFLSTPSLSSEEVVADGALTNNKRMLSRMRNKAGRATRMELRQAKLPVNKISDHGIKFHEVIEVHSNKEDTGAARSVKPQAHERPQRVNMNRLERKETPKPKKAPWNEPAFIARIELSKNEISTSPMQLSEPQGNPPQEFDLRVWDPTSPAMANGATPATSAQEGAQRVDLTVEENLSEHKTEPVSYLQIRSVKQAIIHPSTFQAKTSAEIGIQVDYRPSTPKARFAAKRPSSRFKVASTKLISKVQPLEKSISITALTPQTKSGLNTRITRPPTALRIQRKPTTPSPRALHSDKRFKPEAVNNQIVNILREIDNVILCEIESKFEAVRSDWKAAHHRMLVGTQEKVQHMHQANVDHYNTLVELYERYTVERRANLQLFDEMKRSNHEALDGVKEAIFRHNRHSLSKKFPKSVFAGIPPAIQTHRYLSVIP